MVISMKISFMQLSYDLLSCSGSIPDILFPIYDELILGLSFFMGPVEFNSYWAVPDAWSFNAPWSNVLFLPGPVTGQEVFFKGI